MSVKLSLCDSLDAIQRTLYVIVTVLDLNFI